jgi:large repetitive protein
MSVTDDGRPAARTASHIASWFRLALLVSVSDLAIHVHEAVAATAANASATTTPNVPVVIDLTSDITTLVGYTPIVTVTTAPSHGSASVTGEVATYTPAAGFTGTDTFVYTVNGDFFPASATVTVTVIAPQVPTLDPSVYGMIGALQQTMLLSAFAQVDNFNRHLENLRDELRQDKQLGISINGQSSPGSSVRIASIASMFMSPSLQVASDAQRSGLGPQTAQADASDAVPIELPDRIGLFLNGNLSLRQITGRNGVPDASPRTTSVSGGVDYRLNAGTIIGLGAGYTGNTTDIGGGSKSTADAFNITAYGTTRPIDPVYIDAQANYNHISFNTLRDVAGTAFLRGNPNGNIFSGSLTGGYEFDAGPYTFGPYLRADGAHGVIDSFTESGPSALAVTAGGQTVDSVHAVLGFRGDRAISTDYGILSPHIRGEYLHEFIGASNASVAFANGAASGFQVAGYPVTRNYLMLGAGASFLTVSALSFFVDYDALVGYTNQTSHSITAGASIRF